jgi:hypothetical protein
LKKISISAGFSVLENGRKWSDIMYDVIPFIIQLDNDFYLNKFYNDSILDIFLMENIQVIKLLFNK